MMVPVLQVRFYCTESGREPVREWLKHDLSLEDRKTVGIDIKTVQFGWPIGMPVVRKIETDLWEVRSRIKNGIARTFFTVIDTDIVLLHGFVKKSQKTPKEDLQIAPGTSQGARVMNRHANIGSDFDEFLAEEGVLEEANAIAVKRVIAWQIGQAMKETGVTKSALARRMKTSRTVVDRVLDGADASLTLDTMTRAATALGRRIKFDLVAS